LQDTDSFPANRTATASLYGRVSVCLSADPFRTVFRLPLEPLRGPTDPRLGENGSLSFHSSQGTDNRDPMSVFVGWSPPEWTCRWNRPPRNVLREKDCLFPASASLAINAAILSSSHEKESNVSLGGQQAGMGRTSTTTTAAAVRGMGLSESFLLVSRRNASLSLACRSSP